MSNESVLVTSTSAQIFDEVLAQMRDELDEHRGVLNDTTNEIQNNFDFFCDLDRKIDKLQARVDSLHLLVMGSSTGAQKFKTAPLSGKEKEVFSAILALTEGAPCVTFANIGESLKIPASVVGGYVSRMQEKGVPVMKTFKNGQVLICIEHAFREAHIKQNVVGVDAPLARWL